MVLAIVLLALLASLCNATMTDQEKYNQLYQSLSALEAHPSPSNTAKIDLILKSTDFLRLQALYGQGKKRFTIKHLMPNRKPTAQAVRHPVPVPPKRMPVRHQPVMIRKARV